MNVSRIWGAITLLIALVTFVGCTPKECETSENCPPGTVCSTSGTCQQLQCTSSNDCPVGNFCDRDRGDCTAGCVSDNDCLPSEQCDVEQRQCITQGCRNTKLDCAVGEFCNELSGECFDAGNAYCRPCERNEDCGNQGANICLRVGGQLDAYCGVDCSGGQECPAGYTCLRVTTTGSTTLSYQCLAACWELDP
jgi:hypothetical protein